MKAFLRLVLKGSAVSAFALTLAAVGCSDSDKDNEPGAGGDDGGGKGGTSSAGSGNDKGGEGGAGATTPGGADAGGAASGGADAGGADAGGADAGGAGGSDSGLSVAKFCNDLVTGEEPNEEDTTFILEIGEGADKVTFTAKTGECVPADGDACKSIPIGAEVPVKLFDADAPTVVLDNGVIDSADGDKWIFNTTVSDDAEPAPVVEGNTVKPEFTCEEITYNDVYPPAE